MAEPKPEQKEPRVPPTPGYTYTADGRFIFTEVAMAQMIERLRWAAAQEKEST